MINAPQPWSSGPLGLSYLNTKDEEASLVIPLISLGKNNDTIQHHELKIK